MFSDQVPTLPELFIFTGKSGKRYRVLDRIGPFWEELAFALNFESYVTETIKKSAMYQVRWQHIIHCVYIQYCGTTFKFSQ